MEEIYELEERGRAVIMKKRISLMLGSGILVLGLAAGGFAAAAGNLPKEQVCLDGLKDSASLDKDAAYARYLSEKVSEAIIDNHEVLDCEMDIICSKGKILSATVRITPKEDGSSVSGTDILDYVSRALGITDKNISLSIE